MMASPYRLEWQGGFFEAWEFAAIMSHPMFYVGTVFEFHPDIGWIAI